MVDCLLYLLVLFVSFHFNILVHVFSYAHQGCRHARCSLRLELLFSLEHLLIV